MEALTNKGDSSPTFPTDMINAFLASVHLMNMRMVKCEDSMRMIKDQMDMMQRQNQTIIGVLKSTIGGLQSVTLNQRLSAEELSLVFQNLTLLEKAQP